MAINKPFDFNAEKDAGFSVNGVRFAEWDNATGKVKLTGQVDVDSTLVFSDGESIDDDNGNELLEFGVTANAVNQVKVTNAATGGSPTVSAVGTDSDIALTLASKGGLPIILSSQIVLKLQGTPSAFTVSATADPGALLGGLMTVNQGAGATSAIQLPTATDMDAVSPLLVDGISAEFSLINISTVAAEDASITTNTGWTLVGNMDVASNAAATDKSSGRFLARKTGTAAWTLYRIA